MARRFRLAFLDTTASQQALPTVAKIMSEELKWSALHTSSEVNDAINFIDTMRAK